jgi:hypothetical protein
MLTFIPFHLTSIERLPDVDSLLWSWLAASTEVLTPEDWFKRGHNILGGITDAKGFWRHEIKPGTFV